MKRFIHLKIIFVAFLSLNLFAVGAFSQTTVFTFQGRLTDSSSAGNSYDFEFRLFDADGNQIGSTLLREDVSLADGIFTVRLDFGASAFAAGSAGNRFLEIGVRAGTSSGTFTILSPRQPLTGAPFAIRALAADDSQKLGGAAANLFVQTNDPRLADARLPAAGSGNYIQNTAAQQTADFNIIGKGAASTFDAVLQYNIGGQKVLSATGNDSLFAGFNAGTNTTGSVNSFFGASAGAVTTTGNSNSFFGAFAGASNTASFNSFFGAGAGSGNTTGHSNSFFGVAAGSGNTTGTVNSFFGRAAGQRNTTGASNSFFGVGAGQSNTTGNNNVFVGVNAGFSNMTADNNIFVGASAGQNNTIGTSNTFVGNRAGQDNSTGISNSFVGALAGAANTTGGGNSFFGVTAGRSNTQGNNNSFFGASAGASQTTGSSNSFFGLAAGDGNTSGNSNSFFGERTGSLNTSGSSNTLIGSAANVSEGNLNHATAIGADSLVLQSNTIALGRPDGSDKVVVYGLGVGSEHLCINTSRQISFCASSLRYKTDIAPFNSGLSVVNRLQPITFAWKEGGSKDLGFAAEEAGEIEPLLVTRNSRGEIQGVKYDRITAVLVNAVKEQQALLQAQAQRLKEQQSLINGLRQLVCQANAQAEVCK